MPAAKSWFKVHARVVLAQGSATLTQLSDPDNTVALLDLATVGLNGADLRRELDDRLTQLADHLTAQVQAATWVDEARAEVRQTAANCFEWRKRLFARLRYAATCGADPDTSFSRTFGFRTLPRARAQGLLRELPRLFQALGQLEATLQPHGIRHAFVEEGRLHHGRLQAAQGDLDSALQARKTATQAVRSGHTQVRDYLLRLVAADEAAALEFGRAPCFSLSVLRPPEPTSSGEPAG